MDKAKQQTIAGRQARGSLFRVSVNGGRPMHIPDVEAGKKETIGFGLGSFCHPKVRSLLSDGGWVIYVLH